LSWSQKESWMEKRSQRAEGFNIRPLGNLIFVADYGQPDMTSGGVFYGDSHTQFGRYRASEWRHGEVIAVGPGLLRDDGVLEPMPPVSVGDVIMFSRKHGTRLPGEIRYRHPKYTDNHPASRGLLIRVLDPEKCQAVCEDFKPWWRVQESQLDPSGIMTG
jgi:co-chaperonin GroES (HSP10)